MFITKIHRFQIIVLNTVRRLCYGGDKWAAANTQNIVFYLDTTTFVVQAQQLV